MIQIFSNEFKVKKEYFGDFQFFINSVGLTYGHNSHKNTYFINGTSEGYQTLYNLNTQLYNIAFNEVNVYADEEDEDNLKAIVNFTWFLSKVVDSVAIYYEFDTETQRIIATRVNDDYCEERDLDLLMNMYEN